MKGPVVRISLVQIALVVLLIRILSGGVVGQPVEGSNGPVSEAAAAAALRLRSRRRRSRGVEAEGARHQDPDDEDDGEGDDKTDDGEGHVREAVGENCKKIRGQQEREREREVVVGVLCVIMKVFV